jgi:hypothetical protein
VKRTKEELAGGKGLAWERCLPKRRGGKETRPANQSLAGPGRAAQHAMVRAPARGLHRAEPTNQTTPPRRVGAGTPQIHMRFSPFVACVRPVGPPVRACATERRKPNPVSSIRPSTSPHREADTGAPAAGRGTLACAELDATSSLQYKREMLFFLEIRRGASQVIPYDSQFATPAPL